MTSTQLVCTSGRAISTSKSKTIMNRRCAATARLCTIAKRPSLNSTLMTIGSSWPSNAIIARRNDMGRYGVVFLAATWFLAPAMGAAQTSATALADFYWSTGHYQSAAFYAQGKKPDDKKDTPKDSVKQPISLEKYIAEALKNNPEIRVAEAKVRETEAELARTRMKVTSDITTLSAEIQAAQAGVQEAEVRYERAKALAKRNALSQEELDYAKHTTA